MSFRLWTIFYVFALIASAMATFGRWGILVACAVIGFWAWLYSSYTPQTVVGWLMLIGIVLFFLAVLFLPGVQSARESSRTRSCLNNLKQLTVGLIAYDSRTGSLPPAYISDPSGRPLLSWRVAILPLIEEQTLFDRIDRTKAWDDPVNRTALSVMISDMQCPSDYSTRPTTNYFAIVGPQTAWPGSRGCKIADISDGASNTILLIEAHGRQTHWMEPRDLTFDEAVDLLSRQASANDGHEIEHGFFYKRSYGRTVAFANGNLAFLQAPLDRKLAAALLTINGHEPIDRAALETAIQPQLDYSKCYIFAVFVILSILPAVRLRKGKTITPGDV